MRHPAPLRVWINPMVAILVSLSVSLVGCAQFPSLENFDPLDPFAPPPALTPPPEDDQVVREYRIGVPDLLQLTVWRQEDVSGPLLVRRDGKVSVPLVGDVRAEGRTPVELAEVIRSSLKKFVSKPRVDVAVLEMRSQVASVIGGGIEREGQIELQRSTRVIDAIATMGGLTPFAKKKRIRILRNTRDGQVEYNFDYNAFIRGEAPKSNLLLHPGDTIIVPD